MSFANIRVAFANESKLEWIPLKDTPGFAGTDIPGIQCKFFGKEGVGPWFYLVKHEGDVFHYILEGEWQIGSSELRFGPGFMQYEQKGLYYDPLISGPQGSLFLAIYDNAPNFIEAKGDEKAVAPETSYAE